MKTQEEWRYNLDTKVWTLGSTDIKLIPFTLADERIAWTITRRWQVIAETPSLDRAKKIAESLHTLGGDT